VARCYRGARTLSGKKSRPLISSTAFLAAPMPGMAFRPVSSTPLMTPFRRIVATTVAAAMAAPSTGIDLEIRRDSRAPAHRVNLFLFVLAMNGRDATGLPGELSKSQHRQNC